MIIEKAKIDTDDNTHEPIVFFKGVMPLEFAQEAIKNPESYGKQLGEEFLKQIHDKLKVRVQ
jgi:hypothetical protein